MKQQYDKIKEFIGRLPSKTRKMIVAVITGLVIFSVVTAVMLNHKEYAVLFSGLNEEEATEVIAKLQDSGVDYQYSQDGRVLVPTEAVDKTRATMAMEGYPKSGFAYDTFIGNSGLMSTESDKETYKLYDLQNRIGATIRLFEGVESSVVTINPAETKKYVLDNSEPSVSTAYVVVNMKDGGSPTREQVEGIQRLVAKSVPNMDLGDVAVIDGNGIDVSVIRSDDESSSRATDKKTEYEQKVENQIEEKVLNILEPIYGRNNIKVSVKCTADMQKIISEEINFSAPDTQNNSGYISRQSVANEGTGTGGAQGGIPGAQTNTGIPQYNTNGAGNGTYSSSSADTEYELNQRKVQNQNDSGAITDMSIAVSINNKSTGSANLPDDQIIGAVARAAGMDPEEQTQKIAVVRTDFYDNTPEAEQADGKNPPLKPEKTWIQKYFPFVLAGAGALLLITVIVSLIVHKRRKKKRMKAALEAAKNGEKIVYVKSDEEAQAAQPEESLAEEFLNLRNERGLKLKEEIKGFAEENPEISASLLKSWLRGDDGNG